MPEGFAPAFWAAAALPGALLTPPLAVPVVVPVEEPVVVPGVVVVPGEVVLLLVVCANASVLVNARTAASPSKRLPR